MTNIKRALLMSFGLCALCSCASFKDIHSRPSMKGVAQVALVPKGQQQLQSAKVVSAWWKTLGDKKLTALIDQALAHNKDIAIAKAHLSEVRQIAHASRFDRFPTLTSKASANRSRTSGRLDLGASQVAHYVDVGFDASWELDMLGHVSQHIKADEERVAAAQSDVHHVYVTVAAEVARTYIELRGTQCRLAIAQSNVSNQQETYKLTIALVEGGRGLSFDQLRAQTQLALTQSTVPKLEADVMADIHRLSVLTGQVPASLQTMLVKAEALPTIPKAIHVGNVSALLHRRPDIMASEHQLSAAIADYNVSVAAQFPTVSIAGSLGFAATAFSGFGAPAVAASLGPSVFWSAFDMGRVKANIAQNDARAKGAVARYEKTVLEALEELQTAVHRFSKEEERRAQCFAAVHSGKEAARIARLRYKSGKDRLIDLLSAESTLLQAEDQLALSDISAALDLIAIYKALGGGWEAKSAL